MDTNIYNGYGNPYFKHGGQGFHNDFFAINNAMEDAILKALIPVLDLYSLDELAAVTTYVSSYGNAMFKDYLAVRKARFGREGSTDPEFMAAARLEEVAKRCYEVVSEAANTVLKPHLDTLTYYEAVALTSYVSANLLGVFATYTLSRQMKESGNKYGRLGTVKKADELLAEQRRNLGLPEAGEDFPDKEFLTQETLECAIIVGLVEGEVEDGQE